MDTGAIHTVAIGSDHAGYALKTAIADFLPQRRHADGARPLTCIEPTLGSCDAGAVLFLHNGMATVWALRRALFDDPLTGFIAFRNWLVMFP